MRQKFLVLASLCIFGFGIAAHASTISAGIYNLDNAYVNGYSVTGAITLNSMGNATASNLTFNDPHFDNPGLPNFNQTAYSSSYNGLSQNYIISSGNIGQIALIFDTTADANGHFNLCLGSAQCGTSLGTIDPSTLQIYAFYNSTAGVNFGLMNTDFSSGYLESANRPAVALTPEPLPLILLGTGIIGLAGATRFIKSETPSPSKEIEI